MRLLKKYLMDDSVKIIDLTSQTLWVSMKLYFTLPNSSCDVVQTALSWILRLCLFSANSDLLLFLSLSSQLGAFLYFFVYMVCVPFFCRCFINTTIHCLFKKIQSIWWGHRYVFTVPFKVKISLHLITHLSLLFVHMLSFIVPISACNRLEKLLSDFIWAYSEEGKNFHLVKYSFMVLPGDFGLGDSKSAGY